jgi:hypothetical protein
MFPYAATEDFGLDEGDGIGMGDDEEDEVDRSAPSFAEHAFNFNHFEEVRFPSFSLCFVRFKH